MSFGKDRGGSNAECLVVVVPDSINSNSFSRGPVGAHKAAGKDFDLMSASGHHARRVMGAGGDAAGRRLGWILVAE